jgi:hypothetical protein
MSERESTTLPGGERHHGIMQWFDARERNALLALLAAAVLLILCSLAGGMSPSSALAAEPPSFTVQVIPAP